MTDVDAESRPARATRPKKPRSDGAADGLQPDKTCTCLGIRLHYREQGQGRPLVLLHGFGASSFSWRRIMPALSGRCRVIAPDLKGFGLSQKPRDTGYAVADQAELIIDFMRRLDLQNVILGGHSFGGAVALLTELTISETSESPISGLILMDAAAYPQPLPAFFKILRTPLLNRLTLSLLPPAMLVRSMLKQSVYDPRTITEEMVTGYSAGLAQPGAGWTALATARRIIPPNADTLPSLYPSISKPSLILWGAEDRITPLASGKRLAEALPSSRLTVFSSCGHMPQEEWASGTIESVSGFLDSH